MSRTTYATPLLQKLGDAFMFFFQVLIGTPVLAVFPLVLTVAAWRVFDNPGQMTDEQLYRILLTVYVGSLIPAFVVIVWTCYRAVHWQVELHDDALLLGWIGHTIGISYDDVTFFRRGTFSDRLKQGEGRTRTMPVRIEFLPHKKYTIWLETNDAEGLFQNLRERWPMPPRLTWTAHSMRPSWIRRAAQRDVSRASGWSGVEDQLLLDFCSWP